MGQLGQQQAPWGVSGLAFQTDSAYPLWCDRGRSLRPSSAGGQALPMRFLLPSSPPAVITLPHKQEAVPVRGRLGGSVWSRVRL